MSLKFENSSESCATGLETISTLDRSNRPLHDLRISVIDRCNFRCTYCMPPQDSDHPYTFLNERNWLSFYEIQRIVRLFVQLGVSKVRLTGGEPLLRPNLNELIKELRTIEGIDDFALTTNGSLLSEQAAGLKQAGLDRITVSLDTLDPKIFKTMSGGRGNVANVVDGIEACEDAGFDSIKVNAVLQKGINDQQVLEMVRYFKGRKPILRFIEYMDVGNCNHWNVNNVVAAADIVNTINKVFPIEPLESNYFGEVASRYRFLDGQGEIGFIPSVTQPFCQSCTRARISADGKIYTCLFASEGTDIITSLRDNSTDHYILEKLASIWQRRTDRYSELRSQTPPSKESPPKVEMFQIGG